MAISFLSFIAASALSQAQAVELHYNQPNFYDQSRSVHERPSQPTQGWPDNISPQTDSPRQSPRSVDSGNIDSQYEIKSSGDGDNLNKVQNGQSREICKEGLDGKSECRWYEYNVNSPGQVPYEAPSWKILPEDYKPQ